MNALTRASAQPTPIVPFKPSRGTKFLSYFTAPRTIGGMIGVGVGALAGCSAPICLAVGGVVYTAQTIFTKVVAGGNTLRSAVFIEADHLSRLHVQGGLPFVTVPPVIEALKGCHSFNSKVVINALESLLEFEECFDLLGLNNHYLLTDLIKHIANLKPGQMIAVPLSYMNPRSGGHIILGSIECQGNDRFILRVHNGGEGCEDYHYFRHDPDTGHKLYQTTLEIADIALPQLMQFLKGASSLHAFRCGNDIGKVYRLIPKLKGRILPPRQEQRFWMRKQSGNSCSGYSVKCFLQFYLTEDEYNTFRLQFLDRSVSRLRKRLLQGNCWEKTAEHQLAYDELRKIKERCTHTNTSEVRVENTSLTKASTYVQRVFWNFFFPLSYTIALELRLGIESDDFWILRFHPCFKDLSDAFESFERANPNHTINADNDRAAAHFKQTLRDFYDHLDKSRYSSQELKQLKQCVNEILNVKNSMGWQCALCRFYAIVFKKQSPPLLDPGATLLMNVVVLLGKKEHPQARCALESFYKKFGDDCTKMPSEKKKEYMYVLFRMLYLDDAFTLDDLEVRAGMTAFFLPFQLNLPNYLRKNIHFYQEFRLDKAFPKSAWSALIQQDSKAHPLFPQSFESITPKTLIATLK